MQNEVLINFIINISINKTKKISYYIEINFKKYAHICILIARVYLISYNQETNSERYLRFFSQYLN